MQHTDCIMNNTEQKRPQHELPGAFCYKNKNYLIVGVRAREVDAQSQRLISSRVSKVLY